MPHPRPLQNAFAQCPACKKSTPFKLNIYTDNAGHTWRQEACWREIGGCGYRKSTEIKGQKPVDMSFDGTVKTRYAKQRALSQRTGSPIYQDDVRKRLLGKVYGRRVA